MARSRSFHPAASGADSRERRSGHRDLGLLLMPNHLHLIATPAHENGLRSMSADAHRRYTGAINARFRWAGHHFQSRFDTVLMDEPHLLAARYIALNPVAAGSVRRAEDLPWSSARAQLAGEDEIGNGGADAGVVPDFTALHAARPPPRHGSVRSGADDQMTARGTGMIAVAAARPSAGTGNPGPKPRMDRHPLDQRRSREARSPK